MKLYSILFIIIVNLISKIYCRANVAISIPNFKLTLQLVQSLERCISSNNLQTDCELEFRICVSSFGKCDIINRKFYKSPQQTQILNQDYSQPIKPDQITFDIKIFSQNINGNRKLLLDEYFSLTLSLPNRKYYKHLSNNNVEKMSVSVSSECSKDYFGPKCSKHCKESFNNFRCDSNTGDKICLIECPKNQQCIITNEQAICSCQLGWDGLDCDIPVLSTIAVAPIPSERKNAIDGNTTKRVSISISTIIIITCVIAVLIIVASVCIAILTGKLKRKKQKPTITKINDDHYNLDIIEAKPYTKNSSANSVSSNSVERNNSGTIDSNGYLILKNRGLLPLPPTRDTTLPLIPNQEKEDSVYEEPLVNNARQFEIDCTTQTYLMVEDQDTYEIPSAP